jgi:DNA-binding HxlR family transcriptional regulator
VRIEACGLGAHYPGATMTSSGQFCSIARALDVLGQRWMLLVVRELLMGSRRFGEIRRGLPRISRTMLSARLRELVDTGIASRAVDAEGPVYALTRRGLELDATLRSLGVWGQRWLSRELPHEELDAEALVWDMRRRVDLEALPRSPLVARIETWTDPRRREEHYLLLRRSEVSLCSAHAGFPVELHVRAPLRTLTSWWRGDVSLTEARAAGLVIEGRRERVRAFARWFERYLFAGVPPAS